MLVLKYNPTRKEDLIIKTKLDEMFLAKESIENTALDVPTIIQGKEEYIGFLRIEKFFDELEHLYAGWYEDRCDKYENEDGSPKF